MPVLPDTTMSGANLALSPRWLNEGNNKSLLTTLGQGQDGILDKMRQGMKAHMPGVGTPTALPYIGDDRVMPQGIGETNDAYAARLRLAFSTWQHAGSSRAVMSQVIIYSGTNLSKPNAWIPLSVSVRDSTSNWSSWDQYYTNSDVSKPPEHIRTPSNWNWDGKYDWWRTWLIMYAGVGSAITPAPPWGASLWGDPNISWGFSVPSSFFNGFRTILRQWKSAATYYPWVIWGFDPGDGVTTFPEFEPDGIHNPDGTWGRWGYTSGHVYGPSRNGNFRYVDGSDQPFFDAGATAMATTSGGLPIITTSDVTLALGDVVTQSTSSTQPTQVTKWSAARRTAGLRPIGVAIIPTTTPGGVAVYLPFENVVFSGVVGLTAGAVADAVVNDSARIVRGSNTSIFDTIVGTVNEQGNVYLSHEIKYEARRVVGRHPYEVVNDRTAPSDQAIQRAIEDSQIINTIYGMGSTTVFLPTNTYVLNRPIVLPYSGLTLSGENRASVVLDSSNYIGPTIVCAAPLEAYESVSNAWLGSHRALRMRRSVTNGDQHGLDLNETGIGWDLDGISAFTIEMIYFPYAAGMPAHSDCTLIDSSGGYRGVGYPVTSAFSIKFANDVNNVIFTITTANGTFVTTVADSVIFDTWNELACVYDGVRLYLYLNGTLVQNVHTATGALKMPKDEGVVLGAPNSQLMSENSLGQPLDGLLASMRVSDFARYTGSSYTTASAPFAEDSHTMWVSNWDNSVAPFESARSRYSPSNPSIGTQYLPVQVYTNLVPGPTGVCVENLSISNQAGQGMTVNNCNNLRVRHASIITGRSGIVGRNNSYDSVYEDIVIKAGSGGVKGRYGLTLGRSSYNTQVKDLHVEGCYIGFFTIANTGLSGENYITRNNIDILAVGPTGFSIDGGTNFSDEGELFTDNDVCMWLVGCTSVHCSGISFGSAVSSKSLIIVNTGNEFSLDANVVFDSCFFGVHPDGGHGATPGIVEIQTTGCNVVFDNCSLNALSPVVPYVNEASLAGTTAIVRPRNEQGIAPIHMADANLTITREPFLDRTLNILDALTADRTLTVPAVRDGGHEYFNNTTGGHNVLIKPVGGSSPISLAPGARVVAYFSPTTGELYQV